MLSKNWCSPYKIGKLWVVHKRISIMLIHGAYSPVSYLLLTWRKICCIPMKQHWQKPHAMKFWKSTKVDIQNVYHSRITYKFKPPSMPVFIATLNQMHGFSWEDIHAAKSKFYDCKPALGESDSWKCPPSASLVP